MEAVFGIQTAMVITREVICEQIYRQRSNWNADHPNRALQIREIPLDRLFIAMLRVSVKKQPDEMSKEELRAYAALLLDEVERPPVQRF